MIGRLRTSAVLGASSLVAGLLAYVLFGLLVRHLGATDAAPVSILWTYWGLSAAAITFPVQHWIAHSVALGGGIGATRTARGLLALCLGASGAAGLVAWWLREPLFGRGDSHFPALLALMTVGAFVMGLSRGILTARRRFAALAASLVAEQLARVVSSALLITAGVENPAAFGLAIVSGSFVILLWPPLVRAPRSGASGTVPSFGALGSTAGAQLLAQLVLTSGPIVLALQGGGASQVTALFVTLAVFRAPFILAQSQVAPLTGRWTALVNEGGTAELARIRLALVVGAGPIATSAAALGAVLGGPIIHLVFGRNIEVDPTVAGLLAGGTAVAVANLGATVLAIAQRRASVALRAWVVACLFGAAGVLLLPWAADLNTAVAFVLAEAAAFVTVLAGLWRDAARPPLQPGGTPAAAGEASPR